MKDNRQGTRESAPAGEVSLLSEIESFCLSHGGTTAQAAAFYAQYDKAGWVANGAPVENWRGLLLNFLRGGGGKGDEGAKIPVSASKSASGNGWVDSGQGYRIPPDARKKAEEMKRLLLEDEARERAEREAGTWQS